MSVTGDCPSPILFTLYEKQKKRDSNTDEGDEFVDENNKHLVKNKNNYIDHGSGSRIMYRSEFTVNKQLT